MHRLQGGGQDRLTRADEGLGRRWHLERCRFPETWPLLDRGDDPGEIGVIDDGTGGLGHPALAGRIAAYIGPRCGDRSAACHAAAVSAVIAARRDGADGANGSGVAGCCSARLRVYDVWAAWDGSDSVSFDRRAFHDALEDVARRRLPVVNMSFGSTTTDAATADLLRRCVERGVVLVAAAGDRSPAGSPPLYPAAHRDVIAVGATDPSDRKCESSSTGSHIWISAPGHAIWTVLGDHSLRRQHGTSYAAAIVTAAVWLARRRDPSLTPADVRALLARSVDGRTVPSGRHTDTLGYGRLDMVRLAEVLGA